MSNENKTTTLQLVLAWALVGAPLIWGFLKTMGNAMALFQ
jgi:hypothetical protein